MNKIYFDYLENQKEAKNEEERIRQKIAFYKYKKYRRFVLFGITSAVVGIAILLLKELFLNFIDSQFSFSFIIIGAILFALGAGVLLYSYLQNSSYRNISSPNNIEQGLKSEIQDLRFEILKLKKKGNLSNDSENINRAINNAIDSTLTEDFIKSKIERLYSEKIIEESKWKNKLKDFESLSYRIESELGRLRKSANLNLVIGTLTTVLAITALGYEVFRNELVFSDTVKLLSHYLPRLALIIFIEVFAFFFLKLYKANLSDIKYYNNEKTNVDFKIISLKTAMDSHDKNLIELTIDELVKTERNYNLSKDESKVDLESLKSQKENNKLLTKILGKLTDKL